MSDRAAIQQSLDQFFEAIEEKDMNLLPLGDEASYSGTLMPKTARSFVCKPYSIFLPVQKKLLLDVSLTFPD